MSNFLESKTVRAILWILGCLILLCLVFGLGVTVGYRRAGFVAGFDQNYYRNFFGAPPGGGAGFPASQMPLATHGVVGTVIDVGSSTISVTDQKNNEQSVAISSTTIIRSGNGTVSIGNIAVGDQIAVIGEPNDEGQIGAHFIRIISTSSSTAH